MTTSGPKLQEYAREMRIEPTEPEKLLWRRLSRSQLGGYKFRRQAVLEPFIADFFCPAKGLVVELDGETHLHETDSLRDAQMAKQGFVTLRFTNADIRSNMEGVLITILDTLSKLPDRWDSACAGPTPTPPLKGRG
jgi:very-short-patch-repair endonuclease